MSEELLPCPFCGGVGVVSYHDRHMTFTSFCDNPDCMMEPETSGFDTYLDAACSWNTRTLPSDVQKELEEIINGNLEIRKLEYENGELCIGATHPIMEILFNELANLFEASGAENYVEFSGNHKKHGAMTVLVQKKSCMTPSEKNTKLEADSKRLKALICRAAPIMWAMTGGVVAARKWEKEAAQALAPKKLQPGESDPRD